MTRRTHSLPFQPDRKPDERRARLDGDGRPADLGVKGKHAAGEAQSQLADPQAAVLSRPCTKDGGVIENPLCSVIPDPISFASTHRLSPLRCPEGSTPDIAERFPRRQTDRRAELVLDPAASLTAMPEAPRWSLCRRGGSPRPRSSTTCPAPRVHCRWRIADHASGYSGARRCDDVAQPQPTLPMARAPLRPARPRTMASLERCSATGRKVYNAASALVGEAGNAGIMCAGDPAIRDSRTPRYRRCANRWRRERGVDDRSIARAMQRVRCPIRQQAPRIFRSR